MQIYMVNLRAKIIQLKTISHFLVIHYQKRKPIMYMFQNMWQRQKKQMLAFTVKLTKENVSTQDWPIILLRVKHLKSF